MKITDLKPEIVWKFFHQVTQVPRPSKKEGKMIQYLESFAKEYKIAIKKDAAGNILMSKPATPGYEKLYPREWNEIYPVTKHNFKNILADFWKNLVQ